MEDGMMDSFTALVLTYAAGMLTGFAIAWRLKKAQEPKP